MTDPGVILYGPPASGKDTVTKALNALDPAYTLYQRLKVGAGRTEGYRIASAADLEALRRQAEVIWENHRYGNVYAVDLPSLTAHLAAGVPVLHLGQAEAVGRIKSAVPHARWLAVHLWCPRDVAAERVRGRATGDTDARLKAWDETEPLPDADLFVDTSKVQPDEAARIIHSRLHSS